MKNKIFIFILILLGLGITHPRPLWASTHRHQFQVGTGVGLFAGSEGLRTSFDVDLEPEFFFTDHFSASFRFDATVGRLDSIHLGGRLRYYFGFPNHDRWNLYVGAGGGGILNLEKDGSNFGDIAIPVFGFQYGLTPHIKLGSDISFDIVFNGNNAAFATRIMPLVFKWAF